MKFLQNSILAQTLIKCLGFHLNFFTYKREMLSYDFFHNISVRLFNDKKCCNCINLFPCIFVGFICNEFSIKW